MINNDRWWQTAIIYQVYPRSFQDTTGNGTGDLNGITTRLPYLKDLEIDAIWVSPFYPSPMTDFGYDVSDYCAIDPLFGTMADFEALLAETHRLGLKLILDFVPNHTSDQHPWFQSSRHRQDGKEDWYLWHSPASDGTLPNNWQANFGGPAWTFDKTRNEFYCHSFLPTQPDLNWRHPAVIAAMHDNMRFWLAKGVDGFRVDVLWMMIKDDKFRDNPPDPANPDNLLPLYNTDRPEMQQVTAGLRQVIDEYPARVLIGELYLPIDRLVAYYGTHDDGANLPFNFQLLTLQDWSAQSLATLIKTYEAALPPGAWPNWVLGNHDRPRIATRLGPVRARLAALLLLTLRGTPTIYMGEELGMQDTPIPRDAIRDPAELRQPGQSQGRDPERTPFPWTTGPGAGFTTSHPWLPIGDTTPADAQAQDPSSMLTLYKSLIALRRAHPALVTGTIEQIRAEGPLLTYERHLDGTRLIILLNFSNTPVAIPSATPLFSTVPGRLFPTYDILPNEGMVLKPLTGQAATGSP